MENKTGIPESLLNVVNRLYFIMNLPLTGNYSRVVIMMLSISVRQIPFLFGTLLLSFALTYSPAALAADQAIGQMIWVKGTINATQPGAAPRSLQRRSAILEHDVISTGAGSTGEIGFNDTSVVTLRENSQLKIVEYKYKAGASGNKSVMSVIKGGLRTITGYIPKADPAAYEMKTPVATIGVRGTQYSMVYSDKGLLLKIDQGIITASNSAGTIELQKCQRDDACIRYAIVQSKTIMPQALKKMPVEFAHEPSISANPSMGAPLAPGTTEPGSGGTKTVKGFCVSLITDLIHKLFG